jgi:hypothetical protein
MKELKVIHRCPERLKGHQVVDINVTRDDWCAISGIVPREGKIAGTVALLNARRNVSASFDGFCGNFFDVGSENNGCLTFFSKEGTSKVSSITLNDLTKRTTMDVFLPPGQERDFPIGITINPQCKLLYLIMKSGNIHMYEWNSRTCIRMMKISDMPLFTSFTSSTCDFCVLNRNGELIEFSVQPQKLPTFMSEELGMNSLAILFSRALGIPCSVKILLDELKKDISSRKYEEAIGHYMSLKEQDRHEFLQQVSSLGDKLSEFLLALSEQKNLDIKESTILFHDQDFAANNLEDIRLKLASGKVRYSIKN